MLSRKTVVWMVLLVALALIPACQDGAFVGITPQQVEQVEQQIAQGKAQLQVLPANDPARLAAEAKIAELERLVATYKANLQLQAGAGAGADGSIVAGVQTVAPFLPPPWNAVVLLAGGLIPGVLGWLREAQRRKQVQRAGKDLARAIKSAAIAHGNVLDFNDLTVRAALKSAMPDEARAIVKDAGATIPQPLVVRVHGQVNGQAIPAAA